ncbi:unnamed protein product [Strongylus vulgaris]|uniref:Uncharacterized protein n=1 Tax=Strongylus vulgaris TaxID=40348 RepID=A0A3P7K2T5_STRVU|nr:unnamed protein product [Strongylus vulgaris]
MSPRRERSAETWSGSGAAAAFMVWIAVISAGRIRGDISPVGLTGFDTGVDKRKKLMREFRFRLVMLPVEYGRRGPCGPSLDFSLIVLLLRISIAYTFEDFLAKLICNWYWLPVARDVLQSDPASCSSPL